MTIRKQNSGELKARVNTCLNKLADRDTLSMAANELEIIARTLPNDAFAPFLNCLLATDSSDKSPVRRQSVRLLSVLSAAHGEALSPHLPRMISTVLRRLRDPDSAIRSACVDAVSSIVTHVKSPAPFSSIIEPLADALFHEQDSNIQIGASLCLAAAAEAAPDPIAAELRKLLQRILKLLKTDCFKAKPNLLVFIGTIVSSGCVRSKTSLSSVVATAIEFLSSNDWAARKAAAEVLEKVATAAEGNLGAEFRDLSVAALERRRFDKVKVVRETMNRALDTWRDLPGMTSGRVSSSEDASSNNSSGNNSKNYFPDHLSRSRTDDQVSRIGLETPCPGKLVQTMSPSSTCSSATTSDMSNSKHDGIKTHISPGTRQNLRRNFRSRVIPFDDNLGTFDLRPPKDNLDAQTEFEDMCLIRKQLAHIENQQSDLLHLLQRFMGRSQKGMSSLERRVNGLEKVLDYMSQDFAMSTGMESCCLSPKLSDSFRQQSVNETANKDIASAEMLKLHNPRN